MEDDQTTGVDVLQRGARHESRRVRSVNAEMRAPAERCVLAWVGGGGSGGMRCVPAWVEW